MDYLKKFAVDKEKKSFYNTVRQSDDGKKYRLMILHREPLFGAKGRGRTVNTSLSCEPNPVRQ